MDRTVFFPESGGQSGDKGWINQVEVIDTKYDEIKESILHIIDSPLNFNEGDKVTGRIDWDRRYRIMRLHAASHIMEYFLYKIMGTLRLVGTHVNEKYDSSTYEYPTAFDPEKIKQVENLVNEFISKNYEIQRWEDHDKIGWYHWKAGEIELLCGGTHPKNVKEIGKIIIKRKNGGRGREKILTSLLE